MATRLYRDLWQKARSRTGDALIARECGRSGSRPLDSQPQALSDARSTVRLSYHFMPSGNPNEYTSELWSTANTRPFETASPLKCTHVSIASPLL